LGLGGSEWDLEGVPRPWGERPAIYDALRTRSADELRSLPLPDDALVRAKTGFGWAAGALDGAFGHHTSGPSAGDLATLVLGQLVAATERASESRLAALYETLSSATAMDFVDELVQAVAGHEWQEERLQSLANWLLREAPDREAVKIGIALLGLFQNHDNEELFVTVGRHEEFTLFAAVALQNTSSDPEKSLWRLAQSVTGWGRIHLVERLANTTDEHIQSWLLREGCRNDIMPEYTALICADSGRLVDALALPGVDPELREGARVILSALVGGRGGPAAGIESYEDGPAAISMFVSHLKIEDASVEEFLFLHDLARFLDDDDKESGSGGDQWSSVRPGLAERVAELMRPNLWKDKVLARVEAEGNDFWAASQAAGHLGIDVWEVHFSRLQRGEPEWYAVMQTPDRERAARVVGHAEATLPLDEIASGPAEETGLGGAFGPHSALDFVLQDLRRFPGLGGSLILVGLQSPVVRNRNMAAQALSAWPRSDWPEGTVEAVRSVVEVEPVDRTREVLEALLDGESDQDAF
jgi:hypothetical protein